MSKNHFAKKIAPVVSMSSQEVAALRDALDHMAMLEVATLKSKYGGFVTQDGCNLILKIPLGQRLDVISLSEASREQSA